MVNARGGEEKMMLTLANLGVGTSATNAASWSDKGVGFGQRGMFMAGGDGSLFVLWGLFCFVTWILVMSLLIVLIRYFWKLGDKVK